NGDFAAARAAYEQYVRLYPESQDGHNNLSVALYFDGRINEALESARTAETMSPFGPAQVVLYNQLGYLLILGRTVEARRIVPRLRGGFARAASMWIAAASGQWSSAESLAT